MPRIFMSHSSANNAEAVALRDWLEHQGWRDEVFLDLDPSRGIAAGERWERRLHQAADRCEAVLFLVSKAWLASGWCRRELNLAHRLNKRLFGVLIEDLAMTQVPDDLSGNWQLVRLATGRDHLIFRAILPVTHQEVHVTFSAEGLQRLKHGLERAGLHPKHFEWPPQSDPNRSPYPGLRPMESADAGIFFGRDAAIVEALDKLRGLRESAPPRLLVILGASGAGKSSLLRAGLLPRLARDDRNFFVLPVVRPEHHCITGEKGLLRALEGAFQGQKIALTRAELRTALDAGPGAVRPLLRQLADRVTPPDEEMRATPPALILPIDQGEELLQSDGAEEARQLRKFLRDVLVEEPPSVIVLITIRSDFYERLQLAKELEGVKQQTLSLPPMVQGAYAEVIKGPIRRLEDAGRAITIEERLVERLLRDIGTDDSKDALPLLAFTLERLYEEHYAGGALTLAHYEQMRGINGAIAAATAECFARGHREGLLPQPGPEMDALIHDAFIPHLVRLRADGSVARRVAPLSEIPPRAHALVGLLVDFRLLTQDTRRGPGGTFEIVEVAHEALLREWPTLKKLLDAEVDYLRWLGRTEVRADAWLTAPPEAKAQHLLNELELRQAGAWLARKGIAGVPVLGEYLEHSTMANAEHRGRNYVLTLLSPIFVCSLILLYDLSFPVFGIDRIFDTILVRLFFYFLACMVMIFLIALWERQREPNT